MFHKFSFACNKIHSIEHLCSLDLANVGLAWQQEHSARASVLSEGCGSGCRYWIAACLFAARRMMLLIGQAPAIPCNSLVPSGSLGVIERLCLHTVHYCMYGKGSTNRKWDPCRRQRNMFGNGSWAQASFEQRAARTVQWRSSIGRWHVRIDRDVCVVSISKIRLCTSKVVLNWKAFRVDQERERLQCFSQPASLIAYRRRQMSNLKDIKTV